eukprot:6067144-Amphidinium_carterae.1
MPTTLWTALSPDAEKDYCSAALLDTPSVLLAVALAEKPIVQIIAPESGSSDAVLCTLSARSVQQALEEKCLGPHSPSIESQDDAECFLLSLYSVDKRCLVLSNDSTTSLVKCT